MIVQVVESDDVDGQVAMVGDASGLHGCDVLLIVFIAHRRPCPNYQSGFGQLPKSLPKIYFMDSYVFFVLGYDVIKSHK